MCTRVLGKNVAAKVYPALLCAALADWVLLGCFSCELSASVSSLLCGAARSGNESHVHSRPKAWPNEVKFVSGRPCCRPFGSNKLCVALHFRWAIFMLPLAERIVGREESGDCCQGICRPAKSRLTLITLATDPGPGSTRLRRAADLDSLCSVSGGGSRPICRGGGRGGWGRT